MVPPKLNIVHEQDDDFDRTEHDDTERRGHQPASTPVSAVAAAAAARELAGTTVPHPLPSNIGKLPSADRGEKLRILEALLFAAAEPLDEKSLAQHLKTSDDVLALLAELQGFYAGRGVNLVKVAGKWSFRTASDLSYLLERHASEERRLSKAAMETLAIIAYHQPVTRAEIEEIRGVQTSAGTLDVLDGDRLDPPARPPPCTGASDHVWQYRTIPGALRARRDQGSAGPCRTQGLGPARQHVAAGLHGP